MIKDLQKDEAIPTTGTVLLDFWAPWCGPCKMQSNVIHAVDAKLEEGQATIIKINVEDLPLIAAKFSVRAIPTLVLIKDGIVVKTICGFQKEEAIIELLG